MSQYNVPLALIQPLKQLLEHDGGRESKDYDAEMALDARDKLLVFVKEWESGEWRPDPAKET